MLGLEGYVSPVPLWMDPPLMPKQFRISKHFASYDRAMFLLLPNFMVASSDTCLERMRERHTPVNGQNLTYNWQ